MKLFNNIFCVFSNLFCILPAFLFYKSNNYFDALFCMLTGIGSTFYHLNNNNAPLVNDWFNEQAIRNVDVIMSDMLVLNIATYIIWGHTTKKLQYRGLILLVLLPFEIYIVTLGNEQRENFLAICCIACFISRFSTCKENKVLFLGIILSIFDLLCYRTFAHKHHHNYNFFHGMHHVFGYLSIVIYKYAVIDKNRIPNRERSNSALMDLDNQIISNDDITTEFNDRSESKFSENQERYNVEMRNMQSN